MTIRPTTEADWPSLKTVRLAALLDAPTAFGVSHREAAFIDEREPLASHPHIQVQTMMALAREGM